MLASLDPTQRRRVAIWTLWTLDSMKEWVESGHGPRCWFQYPTFPGLTDRERDVAMAMIEINTMQHGEGFRKLRRGKHVATIVPANLLVLFYLVGVPTSVLTGWATNNVGTALYAILQWLVKKVQAHHDEILRPLQKSLCPEFDFAADRATLKAFESKLAEKGDDAVNEYRSAVEKHEMSQELSLRVVPLRLLPPWELQADGGCIRLPRAPQDSILVFRGGGLFDVVAPYMFLRAVPGLESTEVVDLESELRRCCLLKDCEDDRLLCGFLATWGGKMLDDSEGEFLIDPNGRVVGNKKLRLPRAVPERGRIRFVLTTRAEAFRVALPNGHVLKVEEKMLDSDRQLVNMERATLLSWLDPDAATAWTAFLQDRVLPRVQVQFLFLKSDISPVDATSTRQRLHR
jgi:hypothetical protein